MADADASMAIATAADLLQAYAQGQRAFVNINLPATTLTGENLKGADLSYADFSEANLRGTNLRGADLSYANLREADLTAADLRGAMLIGTDLRLAQVTGTQFHDADYDPQETHFPSGFDPTAAEMRSDRPQ